jgi:amino acid transporter
LIGWVQIRGEILQSMAKEGRLPGWLGQTDRRDVPVGVLVFALVVL